MQAFVIEEANKAGIQDVPSPLDSLQPGWAAVKARVCGICGSDLHAYKGSQPFFIYPGIPGHEVVGEIVAINPSPTGPVRLKNRPIEENLAVGERVVLEPSVPCGSCLPCRTGRYNCCANMRVLGVHLPGAMAEYYTAPLECLHRLPESMSDELGALVEPLSIGMQINNRARTSADDTVLIIGAGTIGLCSLLVALSRGARVAVSDLVDRRLQVAADFGAHLTINPARTDIQAALDDFTGGDGPVVVIEAVGSTRTYQDALELVAPSGRVVLAGLVADQVEFPGSIFVKKELDVLGSRLHGGTIPQTIQLLASGSVDPRPLITHRTDLSGARQSFELMHDHPDEVLKILVYI